ncbi:unnamed protein product [Closterium sp. NIES-53]
MYLMTCTRPDLAYPLSILACYVAPARHRPEHWEAAKRVLRYLCGFSGMGFLLGGRAPVVLTGHADASWVDDLATQRSSQGYTFSLGSGSVSWRSTCASSVPSSSCGAEIYAGAMAAQELRWLIYLHTDLGERPRSSPVLYVDYKAIIALCQEHRLEHRTKHIALRYFLARELQQHGQLRLAYIATVANTADIFTKALQSGDHQPCFAFLDWSCDHLFSPTLPIGQAMTCPAFAPHAAYPCARCPAVRCPAVPAVPCAALPCASLPRAVLPRAALPRAPLLPAHSPARARLLPARTVLPSARTALPFVRAPALSFARAPCCPKRAPRAALPTRPSLPFALALALPFARAPRCP